MGNTSYYVFHIETHLLLLLIPTPPPIYFSEQKKPTSVDLDLFCDSLSVLFKILLQLPTSLDWSAKITKGAQSLASAEILSLLIK